MELVVCGVIEGKHAFQLLFPRLDPWPSALLAWVRDATIIAGNLCQVP